MRASGNSSALYPTPMSTCDRVGSDNSILNLICRFTLGERARVDESNADFASLDPSESGRYRSFMAPRVLLVNPPIYDFSAYDFWLKPYGLLRVAGYLRDRADLELFDYLDRRHPSSNEDLCCDGWGRGEFPRENVPTPRMLTPISRRFRRYGLARPPFQQFLQEHGPFDFALVQTVM